MAQFQHTQLIDYVALRQQVTIAQVLELVSWEPSARLGDQQRGPCPIHKSTSDRSRIFSVSLSKNIYQCFKCGSQGNQLDLAAELFQLPLYEATRELCRRLAVEVPYRER